MIPTAFANNETETFRQIVIDGGLRESITPQKNSEGLAQSIQSTRENTTPIGVVIVGWSMIIFASLLMFILTIFWLLGIVAPKRCLYWMGWSTNFMPRLFDTLQLRKWKASVYKRHKRFVGADMT